jgi:hypothetical protein
VPTGLQLMPDLCTGKALPLSVNRKRRVKWLTHLNELGVLQALITEPVLAPGHAIACKDQAHLLSQFVRVFRLDW